MGDGNLMKFAICKRCQTRKWVYTSNICQDCIDEMIHNFESSVLLAARSVIEEDRSD